MARRGAWDDAAHWVPVWISFGESWYDGAEPLPWTAHQALWNTLERYAAHVRYRRWLGGMPRLDVPRERVSRSQRPSTVTSPELAIDLLGRCAYSAGRCALGGPRGEP